MLRPPYICIKICVHPLFAWKVERVLLREFCWASFAEQVPLSKFHWASSTERVPLRSSTEWVLLSDFCWKSSAEPVLLSEFHWASSAEPVPVDNFDFCKNLSTAANNIFLSIFSYSKQSFRLIKWRALQYYNFTVLSYESGFQPSMLLKIEQSSWPILVS